MILQRILFPQNRREETSPLYYKSTKPVTILGNGSVQLQPHSHLDLFSYFNALSEQRWEGFTTLTGCSLYANVSGSGILRLVYQTRSQKMIREEAPFSSKENKPYVFSVPFSHKEGFYSLEVETADGEATLHGAAFLTEEAPRQPVRLALVFCTYRREAYITRNVHGIRQNILGNPASGIYGNLKLYIIDNSRTLTPEAFSSSDITLIPNANTGGTGGFTRGITEVLHQQDSQAFTHVLLMDDDIELDTESLERTYALLSFLRGKYLPAAIGGAMLRNDHPCILEEAGAGWKGKLISYGRGLNLSEKESLFQYDSIGNVQSQAWWYCCIPLSIIGLDNLPLPFFIHGDDTEYGLRNFKYVLQLNGICVWHNTFENKRPSNLEYYDVRNHLILNSMYKSKFSLAGQILGLFKRSTALILRMRYEDVFLNIRGIDDFLKGPEWWGEQDLTKLHQEILESGYQYMPLPKGIQQPNEGQTAQKIAAQNKLKCFLTINGAFFTKHQEPLVIPCGSNPFALYRRAEAYLWDPASDKAIHVRFSMKNMFKMYLLLFWAFLRLIRRYAPVRRLYRNGAKELGSENYWKRYRNLEAETE